MKKVGSVVQIVTLLITVILSVIGFYTLPDVVAVQWNFAGVSNRLPRYAAALIPIGVTLLLIVAWRYSAAKFGRQMEASKTFRLLHSSVFGLLTMTGILLNILFMAFN